MNKKLEKQDEIKGQQRYVDQPGQWINTTPKALQKRQDKALKSLKASMDRRQAKAAKKKR